MLWKVRVLFFYLIISILTVTFYFSFFIPAILILNLLKQYRSEEDIYSLRYKIAVIFSKCFIGITKKLAGLNYEVEGLEKLPSTPSLVLSNHQSFWENLFVQLIIPKHSWVIKRELFNIPFFGWGLKVMEPIAIDRSKTFSVQQIIEGGQQKFSNDHWVIMFPEATRLRPEQVGRFKPSAAKLALKAKVPIVLIAHNAGLFWPKGFWLTKPGKIKVKIIDTIFPEEAEKYDSRSLTEHIEKIINREKQALLIN